MANKELKDKAINIKGKQYVLVADRVTYFNDTYPKGYIVTDYKREGDTYEFRATVTPDSDFPSRRFTGHSQATIGDGMVNKAAAMENAETSAVGRALAMLGIGVIESIASADEMNKAQGSTGTASMKFATQKQIDWMRQAAFEASGEQIGGDNFEKNADEYIKTILTIPPQRVPVFKVKDAVDKIKAAGVPKPPMTDQEMEQAMDKLIDQDININDIPY